jgi:hypothetical protein
VLAVGDGNVARDRRDDLDPDLGRAPGEEQGERVVNSGSVVDQEGVKESPPDGLSSY